jgi:secreted trypsin-like serine protease
MKQAIEYILPQLFQDHLMCAGEDEGHHGACKEDSGGPLMHKDNDLGKYIQIASFSNAVRQCGDKDYPEIFVRLNHPSVWNFIASTINPLPEEQTQISLTGEEEYTTQENIQ